MVIAIALTMLSFFAFLNSKEGAFWWNVGVPLMGGLIAGTMLYYGIAYGILLLWIGGIILALITMMISFFLISAPPVIKPYTF